MFSEKFQFLNATHSIEYFTVFFGTIKKYPGGAKGPLHLRHVLGDIQLGENFLLFAN